MKKLIYKLIDVVTLGKGIKTYISGFSIRMIPRYFKYFRSNYELDNINFIDKNVSKGMTAIEVGAHIGLLSIVLFNKVGDTGKVLSFEPTPSTFKLLKRTVNINKATNVVNPINKAVSEKSGSAFFYVTDIEAHNSNSLSDNKRKEGNAKKINVTLTSIDDLKDELNIRHIDFIKIDAEGAEYSVLKGAERVIEEFHPKIILALHPNSILNFGDTLEEIWNFIESKNYAVIYKQNSIDKNTFINKTELFDVFLI